MARINQRILRFADGRTIHHQRVHWRLSATGAAACGIPVPRSWLAADPADVTCGRCQRSMKKGRTK